MLTAAQQRYRQQQNLSRRTAAQAARLWEQIIDARDLDGSTRAALIPLLRLLIAGQAAAAGTADAYTDAVLLEQSIDTTRTASLNVTGFTGVASDGRSLTTLLQEPTIAVKSALGDGQGLADALQQGVSSLTRIITTQVTDAGRTATSAAAVARPAVDGYIRQLSLPSCSRCAILAGRFYRWSSGFQRHPHCDCINVPTTEATGSDLVTDARTAIEAGQVTGLSAADAKAIADGADISQVVNAHRGMATADVYGRRLKTTSAGASGKTPRLRPEAIYSLASDDRAQALQLLRRYGYLL